MGGNSFRTNFNRFKSYIEIIPKVKECFDSFHYRVNDLLHVIDNKLEPTTAWAVRKWFSVFGSLLLMLPIGLPWYWGNMAVYAISHVAMRGETQSGLDTPWIISFYFLFNAFGLFLAGTFSKYVGKRWVLFTGIVMFASGFFMTYFSVQKSVIYMNLTLGFISGIGGGIVHGMALQYAVGWARHDLGLVTSLVQAGYNAGSVFINPFITMYVNPENAHISVPFGSQILFSEYEVIERIPLFFVVFGLLCLAFFACGFALVREPRLHPSEARALQDETECEEIELFNRDKITKLFTPEEDPVQIIIDHTNMTSKLMGPDSTLKKKLFQTKPITKKRIRRVSESTDDKKPIDILKMGSFYSLCVTLMTFDVAMLVLANYYKIYGSIYIKNDHFVSFLATILTVSTICAIPCWGVLADRIGVKKTLISMYSASSFLSLSMYFTPRINPMLYLINIILLGIFLAPIFSVILIATCNFFGKNYYASNVGMVTSLSLMVNFVNPIIFERIIRGGWFYLFFYSSSLTTLGLLVVILALKHNDKQ